MTPLPVAMLLLAAPTVLACEETRMQHSIAEVKARNEARLMEFPGVVSVGIGRDEAGEEVIIVGLDRDQPELRERLPRRLEGYEVHARFVGRPKAH